MMFNQHWFLKEGSGTVVKENSLIPLHRFNCGLDKGTIDFPINLILIIREDKSFPSDVPSVMEDVIFPVNK
jgi:hypothetical protein